MFAALALFGSAQFSSLWMLDSFLCVAFADTGISPKLITLLTILSILYPILSFAIATLGWFMLEFYRGRTAHEKSNQ